MNPELLLLMAVGKYLLASVALYLFYRLVFRKHASYRESRYFLLGITLLAALVSQFRIEVTKPAPVYVQVAPSLTGIHLSNTVLPAETHPQGSTPPTAAAAPESSQAPAATTSTEAFPKSILHRLTAHLGSIAWMAYGLVALLMLVNLLYQYVRIGRLRRSGNAERRDGYTLVLSAQVDTPFSSGKTIFLPTNLNESQQEVVLRHERWHIRHRHYLDVYLQEVLTCLCWFNPVQWLLRKELRSIHEFETDRSVLSEGTDLYRYQTIILEEVMGNHFRLANGFNQSFTKKRFIQMKNTQNHRLAPSHKLLFVPVLTLLFAALSFVPGHSQVIRIESKSGQTVNLADTVSSFSNVTIDTVSTSSPLHLDLAHINDPGYVQTSFLKSLDSIQFMVDKALPVVRKLAAQTDPSANTADMNALLEAMDIKANNQGISITDLSPDVRKSFTRDDFKQLQKVLENTNDSIRYYRKQKVDRMDSPYLMRPVALAQNMMSSSFVTKLLPELFQVMSRQLSGMMQGMTSTLTPAESERSSKEAAEAGKMMGEMVSQLTKNLSQVIQTQMQPRQEVVVDSVRATTPSSEIVRDSVRASSANTVAIHNQTLINIVLNDPSPEVRYSALKQINDQAIILRVAQKDKYKPLRVEAINRLNDAKVLSTLAQNDPEPDVRVAALNRLGALRNQK